jgi:hypothetical protein
VAITNTAVALLLISSTIKGLTWFQELEVNEEHYTEEGHITARNGTLITNETYLEPFTLKLEYKVETYLLLGIPIVISIMLSLMCLALMGFVVHQYWNRPHPDQYEDLDEELRDNIVETYMKMLLPYVFDPETSKYHDCSICLKSFEETSGADPLM